MIKVDWNNVAAYELRDTFGGEGESYMRDKVVRGDAELWRIDGERQQSYLITEVFDRLLWVWCYQGREFVPLLRRLARIALDNGLSTVGWFTRHSAPLRVFRDVRGTIEPTDVPGEFRYSLSAEDLWQSERTLPERLPRARLAGTTSGLGRPLRAE